MESCAVFALQMQDGAHRAGRKMISMFAAVLPVRHALSSPRIQRCTWRAAAGQHGPAGHMPLCERHPARCVCSPLCRAEST